MNLADEIRNMTDEQLADFLVWGLPYECEDCENFECGCALTCEMETRTQRMLDILTKTVD